MKNCEHKTEKSSVVSSNMTSTTYRSDCKDCGRCFYYTELTVPEILQDEHGDWVIRGVAGEFYPCKAEDFYLHHKLLENDD